MGHLLPCEDAIAKPSPGASTLSLDFPGSRLREIHFCSLQITRAGGFFYSGSHGQRHLPSPVQTGMQRPGLSILPPWSVCHSFRRLHLRHHSLLGINHICNSWGRGGCLLARAASPLCVSECHLSFKGYMLGLGRGHRTHLLSTQLMAGVFQEGQVCWPLEPGKAKPLSLEVVSVQP